MALGAARSKADDAFSSSMTVDGDASPESATASPAQNAARQRGLSARRSCGGGTGTGLTKQGKLESSRVRHSRSFERSAPPVPLEAQSQRSSRGSSVVFVPGDPTSCPAASTTSRGSSPSSETGLYKKSIEGLKSAYSVRGSMQEKAEERGSLPVAAGQHLSSTAATSLRASHRNWQSNCVLLYKHIMSHILEWPTLSVQWLHSCNPRSNGEIGQTILLSTHTSGGAPNYLLLMEISLPAEPIDASGLHYDQRQDYQGFEFGDDDTRKFTITARIPHEGESNRARVSHVNDTLIASKANDGCVYLFDSCKFGPELCTPDSESEEALGHPRKGHMAASAELVLTGHRGQGWGLEWNPAREGWLASSGDDGFVCIWDTQASCTRDKRLSPLHRLAASAERRPLQDVAWKCGEDERDVVVAVGDDGQMSMWDLRAGVSPVHRQSCNHSCANVLALNRVAPNVFATGGADAGLSVWDFRDLRRPAHRLLYIENEALTSLKWHPRNKAVLAAGTTDRFVRIFDCSLIGAEQTSEEAEEGPPEVVFVHGGHLAGITELNWNPLDEQFPWVVASASEDNVLQIWQPSIKALEADAADLLDEGSIDEEVLD